MGRQQLGNSVIDQAASLPFRFDASSHTYTDLRTGEELCHITGMLEQTGWIDRRWYTEESSDRGVAIHKLTADYDLGALHVESCQSPFRGYLLGHVQAVSRACPTWLAVEEPLVEPKWRFGGRPDRDCIVYGMRSTWEIKSGQPERAHQVQLALQAILLGGLAGLPPESIGRFCEYVKDNGKFAVERFTDRRDVDEAYRVIRECCR